jgi:hypothetical protein
MCKYLINELHNIHNNSFLLNYDLLCMPVNTVPIKEKFYEYACLAQKLWFHKLLVNSTLFTYSYLPLHSLPWKQNPKETCNNKCTLCYLKVSPAFLFYLIAIYFMSVTHTIKQRKAGQWVNVKVGNNVKVVCTFKVLYKLFTWGESRKPCN